MRKPPLRNARQHAAYPVPQHGYYSARSDDGSAVLEGGESFADLFAASLNSPRKAVARRDPELGDLVQGEIVQIGAEFAFLDIGGKSEAMISLDELRNEAEARLRTLSAPPAAGGAPPASDGTAPAPQPIELPIDSETP